MRIARETWVILGIGLADLITTIVFIQNDGAQEANPLFRSFLEMGLLAFIMAKIICLGGPLLVLEWARTRRPRFTIVASRSVILVYLLMYGVGTYRANAEAYANETAQWWEHRGRQGLSIGESSMIDKNLPRHRLHRIRTAL
jgi:hypothetical protein